MTLFLLGTAGATYILTQGKIFKGLREKITLLRQLYKNWLFRFLDEILSCPLCCGFWVSVPVYFMTIKELDLALFAYCCSGGLVSMTSYEVIRFLKRR